MEEEIHPIYKDHGNVKFLIGKNRCLLLVLDNFLFKRANGAFPTTSWKCASVARGCFATLVTVNGLLKKSNIAKPHTHPAPIDEIKVIQTNMKIKSRVKQEFELTPRQIHA